ncbi:unnamed protein product [Nippostrongylus brasiliensis]|uniref:Ras-GAP domain-containing protein n=1 Tax=Nippostrongylus brasiliensis TaxID=27835 RepID=A0A0N4Y5D0_NIPBR|nr:unnamed protein product [Nippostrongylus brasiliensis]
MAPTSYLNSDGSSLASKIASKFQVDNIMMLADIVEEALNKYHEPEKLFAKIGMNLREYTSNSSVVNSRIPEHDRLDTQCLKILGVNCNVENNLFNVETKFPADAPNV